MTVVVFLSSLLGFMTLGMPIAFALLLTGSVLMWYLDFWDVQLLAQNLQAGRRISARLASLALTPKQLTPRQLKSLAAAVSSWQL